MQNIEIVKKQFYIKCHEHLYTAIQEILDSFTGYLINYPELFYADTKPCKFRYKEAFGGPPTPASVL